MGLKVTSSFVLTDQTDQTGLPQVSKEYLTIYVHDRFTYDLKYNGSENFTYLQEESERVLNEIVDDYTAHYNSGRIAWLFMKEKYRERRNIRTILANEATDRN